MLLLKCLSPFYHKDLCVLKIHVTLFSNKLVLYLKLRCRSESILLVSRYFFNNKICSLKVVHIVNVGLEMSFFIIIDLHSKKIGYLTRNFINFINMWKSIYTCPRCLCFNALSWLLLFLQWVVCCGYRICFISVYWPTNVK